MRFSFPKLSACLMWSGLSFALVTFPEARLASADFEVMFEDQSYDPGLPITEVAPEDFSEVKASQWNGYFPSLWRWEETTFLAALDGSKQPQDFGVNANLGGQAAINTAFPVFEAWGVGIQAGSSIVASSNAVRVYELLGEETGRTQSFTTLGAFQRTDSGFGWGFVHDFLYEKSFDSFQLGQWRMRGSYLLNPRNEIGVNAAFRSNSDTGVFGANTPVTLRPIDQGSFYLRHYWKTGAQTTGWFGLADEHSENNAVTGPSSSKNNPFLFGADVLMPLTASLAIYGETNIIMPSDTGTVDAFLGIQWYPGGNVFRARRGRYSPMMSLASPTTFSVDLLQ
ncbi:DUF6666 family protein [Pirellulaceae bacterium SH501]